MFVSVSILFQYKIKIVHSELFFGRYYQVKVFIYLFLLSHLKVFEVVYCSNNRTCLKIDQPFMTHY